MSVLLILLWASFLRLGDLAEPRSGGSGTRDVEAHAVQCMASHTSPKAAVLLQQHLNNNNSKNKHINNNKNKHNNNNSKNNKNNNNNSKNKHNNNSKNNKNNPGRTAAIAALAIVCVGIAICTLLRYSLLVAIVAVVVFVVIGGGGVVLKQLGYQTT
ncbi:unnamed protein product [Polarella glacialis]|uniref:Uncharacterized protein n=1 Tax=Polarella glacialis TaxID=89957 RepID=A0A813L199_POLGL|nr:unnamed protein product [Polarella glacialis]